MKTEQYYVRLPLVEDSKHGGSIYVNPGQVQYVRDSGDYSMEDSDYQQCIIGIGGKEFILDISPKDTLAAIFGLYESMVKTPESKDIQGFI